MKHPAWKRSIAKRAFRLRKALSDKQLARRLEVPLYTLHNWLYPRRK